VSREEGRIGGGGDGLENGVAGEEGGGADVAVHVHAVDGAVSQDLKVGFDEVFLRRRKSPSCSQEWSGWQWRDVSRLRQQVVSSTAPSTTRFLYVSVICGDAGVEERVYGGVEGGEGGD